MRFAILGLLRAEREGGPPRLGSPNQRLLLAVLLANARRAVAIHGELGYRLDLARALVELGAATDAVNRLAGGRPAGDATAVLTDADVAELYDLMYRRDAERSPDIAFYVGLVMGAATVLDVGCGTGAMLHAARERGHTGRLVGLDPDHAALARARRRADVEWVAGRAADATWDGEFELATMTGNAFQCLLTDEEIRTSLTAIRRALTDGGRFAFETRNPLVRAWEEWIPSRRHEVTGPGGRELRMWHEVESVDGQLVTMTESYGDPDGTAVRVDRASLRFVTAGELDAFLTAAGFTVEARYGDFHRGPFTPASKVIVTIARRA